MNKFKIFTISIMTIITLSFSGCASSPIFGAINVTDHSGVGSVGIVDNKVKEKRVGRSNCYSILNLVAFGDCSINHAKKVGKIKKVHSVEHSTLNVLFFFGRYSTIVTGE